jgi:hypothetical protein
MTQGVTGSYAIDGVDLLLQPTTGRWVGREIVAFSGEGRPIYPAPRDFELRWDLMSMDEFSQIQSSFNAVRSSGTAVVDLPKYATTPYQFYSYTGCLLQEPVGLEFFETYVTDVVLVVSNVSGA